MSDKQKRIDAARLKIQGIELVIDPLKKQLSEAESELRQAQASFEFGERVEVGSYSSHGRSYDLEYRGSVIAVPNLPNVKHYVIKGDDGKNHEAYQYMMERTNF